MAGKKLRFLFWIILLGLGFFGGVAWKSKDAANNASLENKGIESTGEETPQSVSSSVRPTAPTLGLTATEKATIKLFEKAAPSVCYITTTNVRIDYFTRNAMEIPRGTGSGFVWDKKGNIVTNFHVIQGADKASVTLADRTTWEAEVVGVAPEKDLAVLRIKAPRQDLIPIPVGTSDDLRVGQAVFAIGNPFGLDQTLTTGIVSALGREIESVAGIPIRDAIQTDAAINPGNSGGPLLDSSGRLIGVNTAIYSPSGASAGIGFSIPVDAVNWVVPELILYGEIKRPSLGVELARPQIVKRLGLTGALVLDIIENSAAKSAGVQPTRRDPYGRILLGDVIIGINNEPIKSNNDVILTLEKYKVGDKIKLKILRDEEELELLLTLDPAR